MDARLRNGARSYFIIEFINSDEYERKVEENEWPGLPFTCEAESEDEAIEKYNNKHCDYDYYKAVEAEFEEEEA